MVAYRQARSGFVQTVATVAAFMAAALAAWAAYRAAHYARLAAGHTERGANAATEANIFSERLSKQQLRAYLQVRLVQIIWEGGEPQFKIFVRNAGQTPAQSFTVGSICRETAGGPSWANVPLTGANYHVFGGIGAGEERPIQINSVGSSGIDFAAAKLKPDNFVFIKGTVKYKDVFDQFWETPFLFFVGINSASEWADMPHGVDGRPMYWPITVAKYVQQYAD